MSHCSRHRCRSDSEWMELIRQCRQSGLSDADWCRNQDIPVSSFYNSVSRLRKKACSIPCPVADSEKVLDLTASSPDVVPILIEPETVPAATDVFHSSENAVQHLDNSHTIEICFGQVSIRVPNGSDPTLLSVILSSVGRILC